MVVTKKAYEKPLLLRQGRLGERTAALVISVVDAS